MIRISDIGGSLKFYDKCFGLKLFNQYNFDDFILLYLRAEEGKFELELTFKHNQKEPYTHGNAYGHLAFSTDKLDDDYSRLKAIGGANPTDIVTFEQKGKKFARFFFVKDPNDYSIEVLERTGRFV